MTDTALMTDRYELTMIDAAMRSGTAFRPSVFEVFARRLPGARRYGVVAGTGRFLERLAEFRFGDAELAWLREHEVVSADLLDWLADYRFSGDIRGYAEGELYFPGSPILVVEGSFAEAVVLETVALSVLNYDSAVANAATRMTRAAKGRPLAEMGSRRAQEEAAIAAARAAYIAGFSATSNLAAGARWGIPTMGTAAHSFTLLHDSEAEAFQAQIDTLGVGTTLLVDTYDVEQGIRTAVEVAGPQLGGIRLDSGDLVEVAAEARALLDSLGATGTRITVTSDLDEYAIAGLQASPVDAYGVGTSVVTGSGAPAAGMVYKLVARQDADGEWVGVAKHSENKASKGGEKIAVRTLSGGVATEETVLLSVDGVVPAEAAALGRALQVPLVTGGEIDARWMGHDGVEAARERHDASVAELPSDAHRLARGEPALPTAFR
ncbi:nicotinate phosphoribosyltransferase [Agrococcus carbonis]|uniref:Nicotinate phosphoribosyltransferase n=1 Tax=Agrococcus carbonis TaxID=684552 RepID=A0A1H1LG82_9MICO|nr:nicotinate phosphoribosyltransferase [Agrococcus carbonis]SDR73513.1 nicotinate phosphoribosyltransferase [Agrococcus carbonis]